MIQKLDQNQIGPSESGPACKFGLKKKKTTYALKTPHVVALPFIYGVESLLFSDDEDLQSAREATSLVFRPSYTLLGI